MMPDQWINPGNVCVDTVACLSGRHIVDVLRLDLIHPVVSGNKWYKLKEYLAEAIRLNRKTILTFGGAFSNHIVATAAATKEYGLKSIGIIRGERPVRLSHTLADAAGFGMQVYFVSRSDYNNKSIPGEVFADHSEKDIYIINEGGYGQKGAEGAKDILKHVRIDRYTHVIAAVGTGTMLAGLIESPGEHHSVLGISVLKNNYSLQNEIENLISENRHRSFTLVHDYHFGGYAKCTKELVGFMNQWYVQTQIPSDFVYTGKLFFAVNDLVEKNHFTDGSKLLVMHSGGLQGNQSLPKGTLIF